MKANTGASGLDALYLGGVYVSIANADQAWWSSRAGVIEKIGVWQSERKAVAKLRFAKRKS